MSRMPYEAPLGARPPTPEGTSPHIGRGLGPVTLRIYHDCRALRVDVVTALAGGARKGTFMIIWRGWGGLAVLYIGLCAGLLGGLIGTSVDVEGAPGALAGLGIVIGGLLTAVHGWYLNLVRPKQWATEWELTERPRLEAAAEQGALVVGNVQPRSWEEAESMIDSVIADGRRAIGKHGPHSVFWIPMEIIGILAVIGGLFLAGTTLVSALTA